MLITSIIPILKQSLKEDAKQNTLLIGAPAIGKSEIIEQLVKELGYDLMIKHPVIESPIDNKGLPATGVVEGELIAQFIPYGDLKRMINATKPLVVFIDDMGQAPQSVQASIMQIIQARRIGEHTISDHVRFIAATNGIKDGAAVSGIITPLLSRFTLLNVEVDVEGWLRWAHKNNMPSALLAYIQMNPQRISTFAETRAGKQGLVNFASPRTIYNLGKWINMGVMEREIWSGCVGQQFANEFSVFYQMKDIILRYMKDIESNPTGADIPSSQSELLFLVNMIGQKASKSEAYFNNLMSFIKRLTVEYQASFITSAISRNEKLKKTTAFTQWHIDNQDFVA